MPVMELAGGYLSAKWIPELAKRLLRLQRERRDAIDRLNDLFLVDPVVLARRYVEPRVQILNPLDHRGEGPPTHAEAVRLHRAVNDFLDGEPEKKDGRHVLFLLGDAGMGKTSALLMLKLSHLTSFWPNIHDFQLFKLGPGTLDEIEALPDKRRTVLLLDSLDEDPEALGAERFEARIKTLLQHTRAFRQVVITCRTQFFPRAGKAPIEGRAKVEVESFVCNLLYISPFSREQVEAYLRKVYPNNLWWWLRSHIGHGDNPRFNRARHLVMDMGELRMRPMLLSYIKDLMADEKLEATQGPGTLWRIYDSLVEQWLLREIQKLQGIQAKRSRSRSRTPLPTREDLRRACRRLALEMARSGRQELSHDELQRFLARAEIESLTALELGGRALLNKDADESFRFAHRTIQEFLVIDELAERAREIPRSAIPEPLKATDEMVRFYLAAVAARIDMPVLAPLLDVSAIEDLATIIWPAQVDGRDVSSTFKAGQHLRFPSMHFRDADLTERDLSGLDLAGYDFTRADLSGADLSGADLSGADLSGADLSGADLSRSQLKDVRSIGTTLGQVNWTGAKSGDVSLELFRVLETGAGLIDLWCPIPAGRGWIGSSKGDGHDDERPRHRIEVTASFSLMATPVTNAQFAAFDRSKVDPEKPLHPVVGISWDDATEFCRWLAQLPGFDGARLPTEEEWEYACRAGTETAYWSGDDEAALSRVGWYKKNSDGSTHAVGEMPANPWDLYDMHGNVFEWTASVWKADYSKQAAGLTVDPAEPPADLAAPPRAGRVIRGGCYWLTAVGARSAYRSRWIPGIEYVGLGFRVLLPSPSGHRS